MTFTDALVCGVIGFVIGVLVSAVVASFDRVEQEPPETAD